jgi:hypothetical protein
MLAQEISLFKTFLVLLSDQKSNMLWTAINCNNLYNMMSSLKKEKVKSMMGIPTCDDKVVARDDKIKQVLEEVTGQKPETIVREPWGLYGARLFDKTYIANSLTLNALARLVHGDGEYSYENPNSISRDDYRKRQRKIKDTSRRFGKKCEEEAEKAKKENGG